MSFTCLVVSPHLKENCGYGKYEFRMKIILNSKSSKAGNRNQTRQLCKCNSRFETRIFPNFVDFRQCANVFKLFGNTISNERGGSGRKILVRVN